MNMSTNDGPLLPFSGLRTTRVPTPAPVERELPVPHNGTPTSVMAAALIRGGVNALQRQVLQFIEGRGDYGAIDEEVQEGLALKVQTETPRRNELVRKGLVRDSGRIRLTTSHRRAVVWVATRQDAEVKNNDAKPAPPADGESGQAQKEIRVY